MTTRVVADFLDVNDQYLRFRRSQKATTDRGPGPKFRIIKSKRKASGIIRYTRRDLLEFVEAQEVTS